MKTWTFKSKSSTAEYTVQMTDDGQVSCNCPGWRNKRADKPRECKHTKEVIATNGVIVPEPPADTAAGSGLPEVMYASGMTENVLDGTLTDASFAAKWGDGNWVMDEKLDGQRVCIGKFGARIVKDGAGNVTLPPHLINAIRRMRDGIYDGELVIPGGIGTDVPNLELRDQLTLMFFDILEYNGQSMMELPYEARRVFLEASVAELGESTHVKVVEQLPATLAAVKAVWARGGEGAILKRKDSLYRSGVRSGDWIKVKRLEAHSVTVTGFIAGKRGPTTVATFVFDDGVEGQTAVLTNEQLEATAKNPKAYIGRRLVIQCQQRHRSGAAMQPRMIAWDHMAGEAE